MWNFRIGTFLNDLRGHADQPPVRKRSCAMPGCAEVGDFRAPKSRDDLREYYWFCLDHVREYNANWDFFKGMSRIEIETQMGQTALWDRPTWRSTKAGLKEAQSARRKVYEHFTGEGVGGDFSLGPDEEEVKARIPVTDIPHPAAEALKEMGLTPPVKWEEVKARYKTLAKKYHPDANRGDRAAEEKFKKVTLAYTVLKLSHENYAKLEGSNE
jgi:DnaJ domain